MHDRAFMYYCERRSRAFVSLSVTQCSLSSFLLSLWTDLVIHTHFAVQTRLNGSGSWLERGLMDIYRNVVLDSSPHFSRRFDAAFAMLLLPLVTVGEHLIGKC